MLTPQQEHVLNSEYNDMIFICPYTVSAGVYVRVREMVSRLMTMSFSYQV